MRVYIELPVESRGLQRVRDALEEYSPANIQIVPDIAQCDLAVIHVYGRNTSVQKQIASLEKAGKQYAMIQYVIRSSMRPNTKDWIKMWMGAKVVWSYYDLAQLIEEDYGERPRNLPFRFYHAPLGTNFDIFNGNALKKYIIAAGSQNYLSESAKECVVATKETGNLMFYLGKELNRGSEIICKTDISDEELASYYRQSTFVSGLRRKEGFELPALEGLMCGARPILFDRPEHRRWFQDLAIFIPEEPREKVIENLKGIFEFSKALPPTVTEQEKTIAMMRFNWQTIMEGFWSRVI